MSNKKQRLEDDDDDDFETVMMDGRPVRILKDGHSFRVPMHLCDSQQRDVAAFAAAMTADHRTPRLHDGRGGPVGQRAGFVYKSDGAAADAKQRAYDQYATDVSQAYQNPPTGFGSREFIGQSEGDLCTINGWPGHLRRGKDGKLTCVPDHNQDAALTATDARAVKDAAYREYEKTLVNAFRGGQS